MQIFDHHTVQHERIQAAIADAETQSEQGITPWPLSIFFEERTLRGTSDVKCIIRIVDMQSDVQQETSDEYESWDQVKQMFPTIRDILENATYDEVFRMDCDRSCCYYLDRIAGHEGLYDDFSDHETMMYMFGVEFFDEDEDEEFERNVEHIRRSTEEYMADRG